MIAISSRKRTLGQGMTEYIIIVALIAIAAIGVYSFFGQTVRQQTAGMAKELSGQSASAQISGAKAAADGAASDASAKKGMGDYASGDAAGGGKK
jgi:Flp pilus assembly pilin Flp